MNSYLDIRNIHHFTGKPKEKPREVSRYECKWLVVDFRKKHQCIGKLLLYLDLLEYWRIYRGRLPRYEYKWLVVDYSKKHQCIGKLLLYLDLLEYWRIYGGGNLDMSVSGWWWTTGGSISV